ncbi:rad2 superfamily protein mus201 [Anticarsia gemmatalis]|uniref:rad2 superfamily protein mus201 n=1 Tax=Anticarsia gemmatalis TaxID=129554 RepID=UPI003F76502E
MGVTGLWRLIEPAGKPVPVETLENKVLAVDISIWLHQMVKGYQDAKGAPLPNAHLMGLFQRLCKLLYFRIKPVFVFDGGFPELKKETIAKRQDHKAKYNSESERIKRELALLLSKKTAVNSLLGKQISPSKQQTSALASNNDDLFKLPALPQREDESESESEDEQNSSGSSIDVHTVDIESSGFKNLSVKEKYDILIELKETRKQNSWGRLQELPKKSDNFSDFQMQRLLKRRKVQECLQETEKEMGDTGMSLNDLESLLNEEGIDTKIDSLPTRRIASNVTSRFLLIKDIKQALADAKKKEENKAGTSSVTITEITETEEKPKADELEDDLQKAIKMSLECTDEPNTSVAKTDDSWTSCMTDSDSEYSGSDSEEGDGFEQPDISCAKAYIMQYSDFTHHAIDELVTEKRKDKNKQKVPKVDDIIDEINKEKSVIVDNVELSSSDDESVKEIEISHDTETCDQMDVEINTIPESREKADENLDATQASVVCIENPAPETINLDSSNEDINNTVELEPVEVKKELDLSDNEFEQPESIKSKEDTESSDSDFEEVPDVDAKINKPVVELTLNVGDEPEDDIFADVFSDKKEKDVLKPVQTEHKEKVEKIDSEIKPFEDFKVPDIPPSKTRAENIENRQNKSQADLAKKNEDADKIDRINQDQDLQDNTVQISKISDSEKVDSSIKPSEISNGSASTSKSSIESVDTPKNTSLPKEIISTEKLNTMVEEIQNQEQDLMQEKGRLDRVGRNITEQMTKEAQELLQIFGIPYIVAPMEAEAQCAFLESAKLTDGTITDDSDIWLFGGRTVYKNFFNQKKHVLQFQAERIETSFNLSREQLVLLALLVGSDYTTGVTGVGPVTAMEILASFPFNKRQLLSETSKQAQYTHIVKGLQEFKQWVKAGKRTDNTSLKKKLKNVALTEDFPSVRVVQAYLEPNVERSEDKFSWGELDITILRDYTKTKFGWSQSKLDEIIKPVLKRIVERKTQRSMQDFFKRKVEFQSLEDQMSKRVKAAVQRMGPDGASIVTTDVVIENPNDKAKPAVKRKAAKPKGQSAGPSAAKQKKSSDDNVLLNQGVKVVSVEKDGKSELEIKIQKTDRFQEFIPQREKDKKSLLENKMKAIELFRKTTLDKKRKTFKKKALKPKEKAELSESDSD